jgi:NitT/TauT family transport system ATP-binding protein
MTTVRSTLSTDSVAPAGRAAPAAVALRGVAKVFGHGRDAVQALADLSFTVRQGEFLCLVGASGCGKSTILSLIAGLDRPTAGTIDVPGERATLMFQDAALFPWLTVEQNVAFPLAMRGMPRPQRKAQVMRLLRMVHLEGFRARRPHELSGGMRQRVALARALAHGAEVLLMDEPFGALDAMMRDVLHEELERLWLASGRTVVFVTHNVREAVRLGDRVLLLSSRPGRVAAEFAVTIARPRRIESADVAALAAAITDRLRAEVLHHAAA